MSSTPQTLDGWIELAGRLKFGPGLFIDGAPASPSGSAAHPVINPATGAVIAELACSNEIDVDRAVEAAHRSFEDGRWRFMPPRERMAVMRRLADLIEENAAELALLETLSMGKPISDAIGIDLPEVVVTFRYFGEAIDKVSGDVSNSPHDAVHFVSREPLGVVGAISPWNYPLLMAAWKVAPALAAGNSVVLKPSELAPLSSIRLAELFMEAGGPPGVFNVVNGTGPEAGRALAMHGKVAKISFTGSTAVGKQLLVYSGQSNMKRVALETGGKSPQIFMPDLADLDRAAEYAVRGIFDNAGQVCNAGSRLQVHRSIKDAFVEAFIRKAEEIYVPGDPLDPATTLGPLVSRGQQAKVLQWIETGRAEGAITALGGSNAPDRPAGAYVLPTLFTNVTPDMAIGREEIFGPVATMLTFDSEDEAIRLANDSIYGLAASVWTSDLARAHRMVKAIEAGVVWVNCFGDGDMSQPFGGYKQSGNTRDKSLECLAGYMQSKSAWISLT